MGGSRLLIIKKKGNIVEFDIDKVEKGIVNSANDVKFILNQGDINVILKQIKKELLKLTVNNRATSTYEIRCLVYQALMDSGFETVMKSYMRF